MGKHLQVRGPQTENNLVRFDNNGFGVDSGLSINDLGDVTMDMTTIVTQPPVEILHSNESPIVFDLSQTCVFKILVQADILNFDFINGEEGKDYSFFFYQQNATDNFSIRSFEPGKFRFIGGNFPQLSSPLFLETPNSLTALTGIITTHAEESRMNVIEGLDFRGN